MPATKMRSTSQLWRHNLSVAKKFYPGLTSFERATLRELTLALGVSVSAGGVVYIDGKWYVTHAGLLRIALRRRCKGIVMDIQTELSSPTLGRWVFKAVVYKSPNSKGFVGYGDADPSNVSPLVHGAEMRVAETRAVNRALRKAYGIGLCSVEELGSFSLPVESVARAANSFTGGRFGCGEPRARAENSYEGDSDKKMFSTMPMTTHSSSDGPVKLLERISDVVAPWAKQSPDRLALVEAGGNWTYRELACAIAESETWLRNLGVWPGDRVMVVCENCRAFVAILLGLAALDAWPVLVNVRLSAREIDQIRDHCDARRVIYTTSMSPHAKEHAKRHGAAVEEVAILGSIGVGPLNEKTKPEPVDTTPASRVAALIYTSGSTGLPKGVMLTHRNLLFVAAVSARIRVLAPDDRVYGILPMSHAVGLSVVFLGALISGATLYLSPRFDPVAALTGLERDRLTVVLGVPAMFALLLEYANSKGIHTLKFPALRIISSSGAPLDPALKASVEKLLGLPLHNGYGVTECSPNIAQANIEKPRKDTSVGQILPGVEVRLVGPDRKAVANGEVGELWVCGPNVMKGYYRAPEETAAAVDVEGWFNTRDLARLDDGNLPKLGGVRFRPSGYNSSKELLCA